MTNSLHTTYIFRYFGQCINLYHYVTIFLKKFENYILSNLVIVVKVFQVLLIIKCLWHFLFEDIISYTDMISQVLLLSVLALLISLVIGVPVKHSHKHSDGNHECNHQYPTIHDIPHHVHLEHKHHVMKRSVEKNLRIKVFYDRSVENLSRKKRNVVKRKVLLDIYPVIYMWNKWHAEMKPFSILGWPYFRWSQMESGIGKIY